MLALTPFYRRSLYNPFRELENFERRFFGDRTEADFRFDLYEKEEKYIIEADLPGFSKSNIDVSIEPPYLTVRAVREVPKDDGDARRYIHSERFFGSIERTFDIADSEAEGINVAYENGVLRITIPKRKNETPKKISLPIE